MSASDLFLEVVFTCEACGWRSADPDAIARHMEDVVSVVVHMRHPDQQVGSALGEGSA